MSADPKLLIVPSSKKVNIEKLTEGDKDPLFVTVEVLNPQISQNKRRWTSALLENVAEQINDKIPDGYMGHVKDEDRGTASPKAQTIWIGAVVKEVAGKLRLLAKGYVLPYAKDLKQYLRKALAAGKQIAVSVYGEALQEYDKVAKVYDVKEFDLESIDWARPGSQGIIGTLVPVLAKEQKMDREEVLKSLTLEELKESRPDLVDALKEELTPKPALTEPTPPEPAEPAKPASPEPSPSAGEAHEMKDIRQVLEVDETAVVKDVVSEMKNDRNDFATSYIEQKIAEKVDKKGLQLVVKRMVLAEMKSYAKVDIDKALESVLESDETKTLISEMIKEEVTKGKVSPQTDNRKRTPGRKFTTL